MCVETFSFAFADNIVQALDLHSQSSNIEHFKTLCYAYLNQLSIKYPVNLADPWDPAVVLHLKPIRMDRAPPIVFTHQHPAVGDAASVYSCRSVVYIVATADIDRDVKLLLDNFYEEFIALASGIELTETPASFIHTDETVFSRVGRLSRRLLVLLRSYNQKFRITYTRLADDQLCVQIDSFMGCASIIAATVKAVLDHLCEYKTDREMPVIAWSMVAIPDPSSLFVHYKYMTSYPIWDCAIGSFQC